MSIISAVCLLDKGHGQYRQTQQCDDGQAPSHSCRQICSSQLLPSFDTPRFYTAQSTHTLRAVHAQTFSQSYICNATCMMLTVNMLPKRVREENTDVRASEIYHSETNRAAHSSCYPVYLLCTIGCSTTLENSVSRKSGLLPTAFISLFLLWGKARQGSGKFRPQSLKKSLVPTTSYLRATFVRILRDCRNLRDSSCCTLQQSRVVKLTKAIRIGTHAAATQRLR
ncbi:unnamed protein product [Ectocarpus fasciculatus]